MFAPAYSRFSRLMAPVGIGLLLFTLGVLLAPPATAQAPGNWAPPDDDAPGPLPAEYFDQFGFTPSRSSAPFLFTPPPSLPVVGGAWVAQGPAPANNGQIENVTDRPVVGAIHTVIAHPSDANILWIGSANGGIWKTTNALAASPTWTPQTDTHDCLSISAMDMDPGDATHNTLVAGIGRYSSFGRAGGPLTNVVLRTTNGGTSWNIASTSLLNGESCSGIIARGATLVFASGELFGFGGLYRSINTGASWTKMDGAGGSGLPADDVHDLVGDPTVSSRLYLTLDDSGVYRSTDTGATWVNISDASQAAVFAGGTNNNAELAVSPGGRVYVAILLSGQLQALEYTDDPTAGAPTWISMDLPTTPAGSSFSVTNATNASPIVITTSAAHGFSSGNYVEIKNVTGNLAANGIHRISSPTSTTFSLNLTVGSGAYVSGGTAIRVNSVNPTEKAGGQGSIHFSIVADPAFPNLVYVGGDRQDLDSFPNYIGAFDYSGRLWRGNTSVAPAGTSPSPQWKHLTHSNAIATIPGGGTASNSAPHADSREMVFDANGNIIETDDAGIYSRTSPDDNTGNWFSVNGNLKVTEQHDIAYDTVSNIVISGNQDTGTTQQQTTGGTTWSSVSTADGGDVAVDAISALPNSIRYSSFQNLGGFRRSTYNSANGLVSTEFPALSGSAGWSPKFVTPIEVNGVNGNRIVIGGSTGILESLDRGNTVTLLSTSSINDDCLAYGANGLAEVLYAATSSTILVRLAGAGAPVATAAAFPGGTVRDLVIHSTDHMTLYVIGSSSVYVTANAGASWTNITGNLGNTDLRAIEFLPGSTTSIAVGGYAGVFSMDLATPGTWNQLGSGLPNMAVYDLDYDPVDDTLAAGTLGRGAWLLQEATAPSDLGVTAGDFVAAGNPGGPFAPSCKTYTLVNNSGASLQWTASTDGWWMSLTPSSGTLGVGEQVDVAVCVNSLAIYAAPGDQTATITFTDTTHAADIERGATLAVTNAPLASFDFNTNPGWTTQGGWAFGVPLGLGSAGGDPTSGHTGTNVYGYNLSGDYPNLLTPAQALTTTAFNCTGRAQVTLNFYRWLGVEASVFDGAKVQVSNNGTTWTDVWVHSGDSFNDGQWILQSFDISATAANQPTVYIRWLMGATDSSVTYPGWNIDDVSLTASGLTMGATVWVDFAYAGIEDGTESQPYNTFDEAHQAVIPGGTIKIKGNTADNDNNETALVLRPVTLTAENGPVAIGRP